ncbi:MAG: hypothetical protein H6907_05380 [Hyphomicrobiales bacterium]|nr:hypothetical protein [Hyphomicrobiales bacterium]MCP5371147.1 hypothetical protein [Hyphomicrobiales bacterium]
MTAMPALRGPDSSPAGSPAANSTSANSTSTDPAAAAPVPRGRLTACFSVHAAADPSVLPRVVQVFARRGLVPSQMYGTLCGPGDGELQVDLQLKGADRDTATRLAAELRTLVAVECVLTSEKWGGA